MWVGVLSLLSRSPVMSSFQICTYHFTGLVIKSGFNKEFTLSTGVFFQSTLNGLLKVQSQQRSLRFKDRKEREEKQDFKGIKSQLFCKIQHNFFLNVF